MRRVCYLLLSVMFLLTACSGEEIPSNQCGSEVWETMPTLTNGVMAYEPLQVLPWNAGRCEATSYHKMAEAESGFYFAHAGYLFYADKAVPDRWVPVCARPECDHIEPADCSAKLQQDCFVIADNRIYYEVNVLDYPHLYSTDACGYALLSMAPDGTDQKLECVIGDALIPAGKWGTILDGTQWLYLSQYLDNLGTNRLRFFKTTETGTTEIIISPSENAEGYLTPANLLGYFGDRYFSNSALDSDKLYRFVGEELVALELSSLHGHLGYLSGNTLRYMVQNEGYFDLSIDTGEVTKIADSRIPNGHGIIILPNCIVESTLFALGMKDRTIGMNHSMEIYNGETWQSVILPEELVHAAQTGFLLPPYVTSDAIWFRYQDNSLFTPDKGYPVTLYRIDLNGDQLTLVQHGVVTAPHYEKQ